MHCRRVELLAVRSACGPRDRLVHQHAAQVIDAGIETACSALRTEFDPGRLNAGQMRVQG